MCLQSFSLHPPFLHHSLSRYLLLLFENSATLSLSLSLTLPPSLCFIPLATKIHCNASQSNFNLVLAQSDGEPSLVKTRTAMSFSLYLSLFLFPFLAPRRAMFNSAS